MHGAQERLVEQLVWESTTPAYIRFVSDRRYRRFSPAVRKWYRPAYPVCRAALADKEQP
jgi:hypothetical protein